MEQKSLKEPGKPRDTTVYPAVIGKKVLLSQRRADGNPASPLYVDPRHVASIFRIKDDGAGINYGNGQFHCVNETVVEATEILASVDV